jgi:hypothetical protein
LEVADGKVRYRFNGRSRPVHPVQQRLHLLFQGGQLLQSNPTSAPGESASEFSEVEILALKVTHS